MELKIIMLHERSQTPFPKSSTNYAILFVLHYRKCRLTYSDRKRISSCQGPGGYSKEELMGGITKGPEQTFGVMGTFIILRVVAAL